MNLKKKEIMKNKEYSVIKNLSVVGLAIATSSVSYASVIHPQNVKSDYSLSQNFTSIAYQYNSVDYKSNINKTINLLLEKAIKIAKSNTPYPIKDIKIDQISDTNGKLTTIDIYMELPDKINDNLIMMQSKKATDLIALDDFLVTYL